LHLSTTKPEGSLTLNLKSLFSPQLIKLALPIVFSNWVYTLQSFLTLLLVSPLGEEVIAGVGFASTILWIIYGVDEVVYTGTAVLVAKRVGKGERAGRFVLYAFILSVAVSLAVWMAGEEFLELFFKVFEIEEKVKRVIEEFFRPVGVLLPLILFANGMNAVFNGAGKTKVIFQATVVAVAVNLGLLAIVVEKMGAFGAGLAFGVAESCAALYYLLRAVGEEVLNPFKDVKFKVNEILKLIKIGLPAGIEEGTASLSFNLFSGLVATCGTAVLAGYQIGLRVEGIAVSVGFALMDASLPFVGQAGGEEVRRRIKELSRTALGLGGALGAVLIGIAPFVGRIFEQSDEAGKWAQVYLFLAGLSQPGFNLAMALSGALRALEETAKAAAVNIGSFWIFRLIPSWLVLRLVKSPLVPWSFMVLETYLRAAILKLVLERKLKKFKGGAL